MDKDLIQKHIKEENGQYCVFSQDGSKKFGCYPDKQKAMDRLKQIESFKKAEDKSIDDVFVRLAKEIEAEMIKATEVKVEPVIVAVEVNPIEQKEVATEVVKAKKKKVPPTAGPEPAIGTFAEAIDSLQEVMDFLKEEGDEEAKEPDEPSEPEEKKKASFSTKKNEAGELEWSLNIPILKINPDQQLVEGIVYEPDVTDLQGDSASPEEIQKAAHNFMIKARRIGLMHQYDVSEKAPIVESYIAKTNFMIGKHMIKKGTWMMVLKINDAELWQDVKSEKITGLSMGGRARSA